MDGINSDTVEVKIPRISRERLSHAYILVSPAEHRETLGRQLAALMLCPNADTSPCFSCNCCKKIMAGIHPDVISITRPLDDKKKQRREVYIAQIREISASSAILPNEADKKVYLITDAEHMNPQAQNALLKLLEEPPRHVSFILCTENPGGFLDTIRSRAIELNVDAKRTGLGFGEREREYLRLVSKANKLDILRFCLEMKALEAKELDEFLIGVRLLAGAVLAGREPDFGISKPQILSIFKLMDDCAVYLKSNVSVKQVLGLIAARTNDLE